MLTVDLVPRIALSVEGIGRCYTEISVHTMPSLEGRTATPKGLDGKSMAF